MARARCRRPAAQCPAPTAAWVTTWTTGDTHPGIPEGLTPSRRDIKTTRRGNRSPLSSPAIPALSPRRRACAKLPGCRHPDLAAQRGQGGADAQVRPHPRWQPFDPSARRKPPGYFSFPTWTGLGHTAGTRPVAQRGAYVTRFSRHDRQFHDRGSLLLGAPLAGGLSPLLRTPPPRSDTAPRTSFEDFLVRRSQAIRQRDGLRATALTSSCARPVQTSSAAAYFQPASRRFFSHTPNTPNCAIQ
jgi:hypothetical protein